MPMRRKVLPGLSLNLIVKVSSSGHKGVSLRKNCVDAALTVKHQQNITTF